MALARERAIPTERPPLVGEVSVSRVQCNEPLRQYSEFSRPEPLHFFLVAPQLYSRG
jgi:hypothetical protein